MTAVWLALLLASGLMAQHVNLEGTWKWKAGDDPRFAQPSFDDSAWSDYELPRRGDVPAGVSWLRKTVGLPVGGIPDPALAIGLVSGCYEVSVNGTKVGDSGCRPEAEPPVPDTHAFSVPAKLLNAEMILIAIRMERRTARMTSLVLRARDTGPYLLANAAHAAEASERGHLRMLQGASPTMLWAITQLVIGLFLLILWIGSRDRMELLWFGSCLLFLAASNCSTIRLLYTGGSPSIEPWFLPLAYLFLNCCCYAFLVAGPLPGWLIGVVSATIFGSRALTELSVYLIPSMALPIAWSVRRLANGTRDQRAFSGAVIVYGALSINSLLLSAVPGWPLPNSIYLGPFQVIYINTISAGVAFVIMLVLTRAVAADRREKYRLAAEFEAARGVQQLLLRRGEENPRYPVDAAYLPATEVGGDFYQRLEDGEGGFTVVVGDVSGKGLKAAMVVSMVVGLLRRDRRLRPGAMLGSLNEALTEGLDGGFVTCVCAHIGADGRIAMANAGHLPPYVGARECVLPPGLPLGVVAGAEYAETEVELGSGEQLTLVSDGVVEAANAKGELFGFERTQAASGRTAGELAEMARTWGQNDDITVVTVRRLG